MKMIKNKILGLLVTLIVLSGMATFASAKTVPNPSADLDHIRNGKASSPDDPGVWHDGNINPQTSHYVEGYSIPYRVVMEDLPIGTPITITIGFDIVKNGKHAIDYLTTYDYIDEPSHNSIYGHAAEAINPLTGVTGAPSAFMTFAIPAPISVDSPEPGQPSASFNALAAADREMTLYGGTITSVVYSDQGDLKLDTDEAQVDITFEADSAIAVLVWGGHLASLDDWGIDVDEPRSASAVSGSPAHTSLVSWSLDTVGQQDHSWQIDPLSSITVKKVIDWGYYTQYQNGADFTFTSSWNGDFTLGNGDSETFVLLAGTYSVTESFASGWALDKIIIEDGKKDLEIPGPTAVVDLKAGESITITFVNKPPDFVIPENPLGTIGSMVALLGGLVLVLAKQKGILNIVVE